MTNRFQDAANAVLAASKPQRVHRPKAVVAQTEWAIAKINKAMRAMATVTPGDKASIEAALASLTTEDLLGVEAAKVVVDITAQITAMVVLIRPDATEALARMKAEIAAIEVLDDAPTA